MIPFDVTPNAAIIGIDPGVTGAVAFLDTQDWTLGVIDMPTIDIVIAGKDRREPAPSALAGLFREIKPILVVSEKLQNMGAAHSSPDALFKMGRWRGHIEGLVAMGELPFESPYPSVWKKTMGLTADKERSRLRANALFPKCTNFWRFKKDHDRCEAAMLALYGALQIGIAPTKVIKPMTLLPEEE